MTTILHIDTALDSGGVCLSADGRLLAERISGNSRDYATWLHPAIQELFKESSIPLTHLNAVAVSIGPGSYTGLRIGLSAAKGICYALNIPLLPVSTLRLMAIATLRQYAGTPGENDLVCPMIDARRMEVYYALFNSAGYPYREPAAVIPGPEFLKEEAAGRKIFCSGNGAQKFHGYFNHENVIFLDDIRQKSEDIIKLSYQGFLSGNSGDLAYTEPLYIKDFYPAPRKNP